MARILIFSDLHLNNWSYGSRLINGVNSRLLAQKSILSQIAAACLKHSVSNVVFCGDLFHKKTNIDPAVLKVAYEGIRDIADIVDKFYLLVGNHDTNRRDMSIHSLHWLSAITGVHVVDRPKDVWFGYMLPFTDDEETLKTWMDMVAKDGSHNLFMHQGVKNVKVGSDFVIPNEILSPDMIPK